MKAVENAVSSLDDSVSFAAYLEELGRRHKARALKPSYLDVSKGQTIIFLGRGGGGWSWKNVLSKFFLVYASFFS